MKWIKINIDDKSTYPPLEKPVFWCRTGRDNYKVYARLKQNRDGDYYADGTFITNDDYWFDIPELKSVLPQAIELYDPLTVQAIFDSLVTNLEQTQVSREQAFDVCFQIAYLISGTGLSEEVLKKVIGYQTSLFENIVCLKTLAEIITWLTHLGQRLCAFLSQNDDQKNHRLITKAKKYISEHYCEEIGLNDLATAINISPGYLSTIFKQYTGICFTDYLTNYKIEEAKKMLRNSDLKIYEISELLGYQNAYYFSKVFKKVTGMTPSEFLAKKF
jgi:two-component system response regulator YesN